MASGGEIAQVFQPMFLGPLLSIEGRKMISLAMKPNKEDLKYIKELIEAGKVKPVIDKRFLLEQVADAMQYYGKGHARGKVIVSMMN